MPQIFYLFLEAELALSPLALAKNYGHFAHTRAGAFDQNLERNLVPHRVKRVNVPDRIAAETEKPGHGVAYTGKGTGKNRRHPGIKLSVEPEVFR
jgi:hypothetical protein